ncbi:hypothetical protein EV361DRAFT_1036215 [Lentinula raphanica]|nr:hypothetical protein EV361DRAFT_1036215 [Lentinula raphanica]
MPTLPYPSHMNDSIKDILVPLGPSHPISPVEDGKDEEDLVGELDADGAGRDVLQYDDDDLDNPVQQQSSTTTTIPNGYCSSLSTKLARSTIFGHLAWCGQHGTGNRGLQPHTLLHPNKETAIPVMLGLQGKEKAGKPGLKSVINPSYTTFIPHLKAEQCPLGAFSFYFHYLFDVKDITSVMNIDWSVNKSWCQAHVPHGPNSPTPPYSERRRILNVATSKLGWSRNLTYRNIYAPALLLMAVLGGAGYKEHSTYDTLWRHIQMPDRFSLKVAISSHHLSSTFYFNLAIGAPSGGQQEQGLLESTVFVRQSVLTGPNIVIACSVADSVNVSLLVSKAKKAAFCPLPPPLTNFLYLFAIMQALISKLHPKSESVQHIHKRPLVECFPFGEVCRCNRQHFLELSTLVKNCQAYLPFLSFDNLFSLSKASDYQAALDELFPTPSSFQTTDRPYAYFDDQMKLLQDLLHQLSTSTVMKKRFIVTTRRHSLIPSDSLALVVFRNLNLLSDIVHNARTKFEVSWWNFLDQNPQKAEAMLIGIMNERRNDPAQSWDKIPNMSFRDFSTLGVGHWLNDEIINYFVEKWCSRSKSTLGFNTFFAGRCLFETGTSCTKVKRFFTEEDEKRVLSWVKARQRKLGLEYWDSVFVPIHESSSHWYSAYIDFRLKRIEVYDSLKETFVSNSQKPATERKNTNLILVKNFSI